MAHDMPTYDVKDETSLKMNEIDLQSLNNISIPSVHSASSSDDEIANGNSIHSHIRHDLSHHSSNSEHSIQNISIDGKDSPSMTLNAENTIQETEPSEIEKHPATLMTSNSVTTDADILKKIHTIKNWSISTYKYTRQLTLEKLGRSTKTIDSEMDLKIAQIRDTQREYLTILRLTHALRSHFNNVVQTQTSLAEVFGELSQRSPELQEEFFHNSESQRNLTKNGGILLTALTCFISTVDILCNKIFSDTLLTIKQFETSRIEFDAYRMDLESTNPNIPGPGLDTAKTNYLKHKENYDKLRSDVTVKIQLLDENRVSILACPFIA